jgi:hypothetical protein
MNNFRFYVISKFSIGVLLSLILTACELSALDPMTNSVKDPNAYTLPRAVFMGTTVKISGSFICSQDSSALYLRPVEKPDGTADIKLKLPPKAITNLTVSFVVPTNDLISEGKYNLIVKRNNKDYLIKRTLSAVSVFANESFNRTEIPGDEIIVSDCKLDTQGASGFAAGDEIVLKGIGFSASDSLYFDVTRPTIKVAPYRVTTTEARFITPSGLKVGAATLRFSNMPIYTVPTGYKPSYVSLANVNFATAITTVSNVVLPLGAVTAGSLISISGTGFLTGDSVLVRMDGLTQQLPIVEAALPNLSFTVPANPSDKKMQLLLKRNGFASFHLGFISTNTGQTNSYINNLLLPAYLPSGLQGKALTFVINGNGFVTGDKIIMGTTVLTTSQVTSTAISVTTTAANTAIGLYDLKLRRGTLPDELLGTVNVIKAPRLFEYAEGGIVYWLDSNNPLKGLVCHVKDAIPATSKTDDELSKIVFGIHTTSNGVILPATSLDKAIGTGAANTLSIKNIQGDNSKAVAYCDTLKTIIEGAEFRNWYIPSLDELSEMHKVRASINTAATVAGRGGEIFNIENSSIQSIPSKTLIVGYMTSTAFTFSRIWGIPFQSTLKPAALTKTNFFRLRAIRSFNLTPIN